MVYIDVTKFDLPEGELEWIDIYSSTGPPKNQADSLKELAHR